MADQPNPNPPTPGKDAPAAQPVSYTVHIGGDMGVGASLFGTVKADQIAGHDIVINGLNIDNQNEKFADLLADLKELLLQAQVDGELPDDQAKIALAEIDSAQEIVETEKNPPKDSLLVKLHNVMETIDNALEALNRSHAPAVLLIKAAPFVVMLIKLASQIF